MKYAVILCDGMADRPIASLNNKTPMEAAFKPNMDFLAQNGEVGMVKTVPEGMPPGSDTANLSVMGYNPEVYYSGRSPLEAVSMGIDLADTDVTFRCNLVTLSDEENLEDATMVDYSSGEITSAEAAILIEALNKEFENDMVKLYPGISYRHCLVLKDAKTGTILTPPHDISKRKVTEHLPKGEYGELLLSMIKRSREILKNHPVNLDRIKRGLNPASSCWFWGEGTKPRLDSFMKLYGVKGAVISAVDLIKGIGICAGLDNIEVEGATGNVDSNFIGKGKAAVKALKEDGYDFVYVHMEAPDECGHRGEAENKVKSIELIDKDVVGTILKEMEGEDISILLLPDHPTPVELMTHVSDPIPYILYRSTKKNENSVESYTEALAEKTGVYELFGHTLMKKLLSE